ncbi:MAG: endonuclease/exonuclease/phosphatase family protein [Opitutales bacterium]
MPNFKLLTFNIAHGRGMSFYQGFSSMRRLEQNLLKICHLINKHRVDFVALQEVDEDSHWNKNLNLLQFIQENTEYDFSIMGVHNRRSGPKKLSYGNAILSRFPFLHWETKPFGTATLGEKGFLYAAVDLAPHPLSIINLHLDYRSRKKRIEQVEKIIDYLCMQTNFVGSTQPVAPIICGDFNSHSRRAGDAVRHLFDFVLSHEDYSLFPEKARTFPAYWPAFGIDFVFVPDTFRVVRSEVLKSYLSDHRPVLVEFEYEFA